MEKSDEATKLRKHFESGMKDFDYPDILVHTTKRELNLRSKSVKLKKFVKLKSVKFQF